MTNFMGSSRLWFLPSFLTCLWLPLSFVGWVFHTTAYIDICFSWYLPSLVLYFYVSFSELQLLANFHHGILCFLDYWYIFFLFFSFPNDWTFFFLNLTCNKQNVLFFWCKSVAMTVILCHCCLSTGITLLLVLIIKFWPESYVFSIKPFLYFSLDLFKNIFTLILSDCSTPKNL